MFRPVDPALDLPALEDEVLTRWRTDDVFAESLRRREGAPEWVFYEGPPTANGRPGIHHVWARLFKDLYPRFHTMRGRRVVRKGGWDCHGLPVEVEVEKELGFSGKQQILDYGIAEFNARCKSSVQRYVEDWGALTSRIGMWLDTAGAYWTMSNGFIESAWWLFREMWDRGDIYEGFKVVPYCGRCGTALSSHELAQPGAYRDLTEDSVYVRFPLVDLEFDLLVWTTTPWTLPSNTGAAIGPAIDYVRVRDPDGGRDLVCARDRVTAVLGETAEIVGSVSVADLVGRHYEPPFRLVAVSGDRAFTVVADEFVTVDDGSGVVHLAPAFGEIDREVGLRENLPLVNPVDDAARFDATIGAPYTGRFVKDADPDLIAALLASGRLVAAVEHTHSYPHCWRCDTPLVYWAKPTWFARTSAHRDALIRENETVSWHPGHIKHGRFGDWLANNVDWALSRDRFWGTPIPVWRCTDCGHDTCIGSIAELSERSGDDCSDLELHRPYVDDITITCGECGGRARRVEPVLDAWFDSGSMPAAQHHYPFENEERFASAFPADFICEAIDQTRGWFYSLLAVNTLVFDRAPYRNVVCLAHIVDGNGQKMSKSRGNVIDPVPVLAEQGADALRWYMLSTGSPWTPKRVSIEGITEAKRQFLLTLWNTYSFFVTYAGLDGWEPGPTAAPTHVLDRWLRSRLHRTVREVTEALDGFDALTGAHSLAALVDDLSNWYVRRSRPRFWKASDPAAHATLHEALTTIVRLLAPYTPFIADAVYANLAGTTESVHLTEWPEADADAVDDALEAEMAEARTLVSLGRAARTSAKIGVRQPLSRAIALRADGAALRPEVVAEIREELNVKSFEVVTTLDGLLAYRVVPNFRTLGPRLGPLAPLVKRELAATDGAAVRHALAETGRFTLVVDGTEVELTAEDIDVRAEEHEHLALAQDGPHAVALDLTLDDELRAEGAARDLSRALNDLRKEHGYRISDRIRIRYRASEPLATAVAHHIDWIRGEVLATEIAPLAPDEPGTPLRIGDGECVVVVTAAD